MQEERLRPAANPAWGQTPYTRIDVERYVSPRHVELEQQCIWPHTWQLACREEEIPEPGDYVEHELAGDSILVTRTRSGQIAGYFNACLHRGTQLAKGCGHVTSFTCPFHGWSWSIDGESRQIIDRADFPGIEQEDLRLPQCQVATWGGFVFVKLEEGGQTLDDYLRPVIEQVEPYRIEELRIRFWRSTMIKCNWKVALEAFDEAYHSMKTHPQSLKGMDDIGVIYETFGDHSRMVITNAAPSPRFGVPIKEQEVLAVSIAGLLDFGLADEAERAFLEQLAATPIPEGTTTRDIFRTMAHERYSSFLPGLSMDQYLKVWHYTLFPNMSFSVMPGTLLGMLVRPNGNDPDSCTLDLFCLQHPCGEQRPSASRETITDPAFDWGEVMSQDFSNLELVQKGLHVRTMKQTRLASYQEKRIFNRHRAIDEYYGRHGG